MKIGYEWAEYLQYLLICCMQNSPSCSVLIIRKALMQIGVRQWHVMSWGEVTGWYECGFFYLPLCLASHLTRENTEWSLKLTSHLYLILRGKRLGALHPHPMCQQPVCSAVGTWKHEIVETVVAMCVLDRSNCAGAGLHKLNLCSKHCIISPLRYK